MQATSPPRILYVGNFRFPDGEAGSHRVYGIGKALRSVGYEVVFLGAETAGRPQDLAPPDGYRYDGFAYYPAGHAGGNPIQRVTRLWCTHLSGLNTMSRVKALWTDAVVAIFAYQASSALLAQLRSFCSRHRIALVADVVEWYDRRHVNWGRFGPFALDSEIRMRFMHGRADGVVAISTYLERYYERRVRRVVRVPVLVDVQADLWRGAPFEREAGAALRLGFVGGAGKKDLLANGIRGLALLGEDARAWEMVIVGPSRSEVSRCLGRDAGVLDVLGDRLRFVGPVPHDVALAHLRQVDFSVLLRPDIRSAHAGFPTKLVESLAMGVPVIGNLTGDIGLHVCDGREGVVVPDCSARAFARGLQRAMALPPEQRVLMRADARRRAETSFDYRNWIVPLGLFMRQVAGRPERAEP
jgi:glycosyltransferase involved in cell wall biosynthesis